MVPGCSSVGLCFPQGFAAQGLGLRSKQGVLNKTIVIFVEERVACANGGGEPAVWQRNLVPPVGVSSWVLGFRIG